MSRRCRSSSTLHVLACACLILMPTQAQREASAEARILAEGHSRRDSVNAHVQRQRTVMAQQRRNPRGRDATNVTEILASLGHSHRAALAAFIEVISGFDACSNDEAEADLRSTLWNFSAAERQMWLNPIKGVWRSIRARGPCEKTKRWWVGDSEGARWHARPMWAHVRSGGVVAGLRCQCQ